MAHCRIQDTRASLSLGFARIVIGQLGRVVPLVFEAGGRPAEETVAYVRSLGGGLDDSERAVVLRGVWQRFSTTLQAGNAEMILSAIGWGP